MYHFDPSNPPSKAGRYASSGPTRKKIDRQKSLPSGGSKPNFRDSTNNTINNNGNFESEKSIHTNNKQTLPNTKVTASVVNNDDQTDLMPLDVSKSCDSTDEDCLTKDDEQCDSLCKFYFDELKRSQNHYLFHLAASQNDVTSQSVYLNPEEVLSPKLKNQSTSPNLPLNETIINEEEVSEFLSIIAKPSCQYFLLGICDTDR